MISRKIWRMVYVLIQQFELWLYLLQKFSYIGWECLGRHLSCTSISLTQSYPPYTFSQSKIAKLVRSLGVTLWVDEYASLGGCEWLDISKTSYNIHIYTNMYIIQNTHRVRLQNNMLTLVNYRTCTYCRYDQPPTSTWDCRCVQA